MSDTKDTPEWMTDEWLHSAKLLTDSPTWEWSKVAGAAREILRLRAELASANHWSGADELTLDRNRLLTENTTLTAELAQVTAERDLHMEASHRRLHELHAAQGALPPAIQRAEKAEAERDAARAEVERLNHLTDDGKMAMANVISALTEADKGRAHGSPVERIRDLACERDAAIRAKHEFAASEVERLAEDWFSDKLKDEDLFGAAKSRAAELRKAAGAAAPVIIDEAPGATLPDVEPKVASGKVVEFSTPAADARQPDIDRLLDRWHRRESEAEGTELAVDQAEADAARRAIHDAIAARLAASEKAKVTLMHAVRKQSADLRRMLESGRPTVHIHRQMLIQALIEPIEDAAERAGGAS